MPVTTPFVTIAAAVAAMPFVPPERVTVGGAGSPSRRPRPSPRRPPFTPDPTKVIVGGLALE